MVSPNFTQCAFDFLTNETNQLLYAYHGPTRGISPNASTQISYSGCLALCGTGSQYYDWFSISNTILTWVLPILGVILQAPFEPHAIWSTVSHPPTLYLLCSSMTLLTAPPLPSGLCTCQMDRLANGLLGLFVVEYQCHQHFSQDRKLPFTTQLPLALTCTCPG